MDVDFTKPRYVSVPEGYVAPEPEPSKHSEELGMGCDPLNESYHSSSDGVGECLGPEGIMGKLFPQDKEDVASDEFPLEGRVKSFAQRLKKR